MARPRNVKNPPKAAVLLQRPTAVLEFDGRWCRIRDDGGWLGAQAVNARAAWSAAFHVLKGLAT